MNPQLLEALCQDFTAIYQCDLIQDTIDIVRYDKGTHTDTAIQTMDSYTLHSLRRWTKGYRIKQPNMDCQPTEITALMRHRAVFS